MLYLKIKSRIFITGAILLSFTACKKQLDINLKNPNGITSAQISGKDVFANALQISSANITNSFAFANEWMAYWARTTSYSSSGNQALIERFNLSNNYSDAVWQSEYHNVYDYNFVIANSSQNSILPGASMVMKAMVFQNMVDIFGNVPYSQASDPNKSTQPAYDDEKTIYKDLIVQLDAAIASIKASQTTADDAADIMFKGDKAKWIHFANTLKLRILMRQIPNANQQAYVTTEIGKIVSEGSGFLRAGEDAVITPGYADIVSKQNPFWNLYGYEVGGATPKANFVFFIANQTMLDFLNDTNDPREGYLYDTTNGRSKGNFLGDANNAKPVGQLATIGRGILKSPSMPGVIMPAFQSFFLQAEAAYRGLLTGDYNALLRQAVEEHFRFLGVPNATAAADAYYNGSSDARVNATAGNPLQAILYQKWVALAETDGLEAWAEYRRTGFPDRTNPSVATSVAVNKIPQRLLYPQTEYNLNSANVNTQTQQQSDIYKPIFWAKP